MTADPRFALDRAIGKALSDRQATNNTDLTKTYRSLSDALADHLTPQKDTHDND